MIVVFVVTFLCADSVVQRPASWLLAKTLTALAPATQNGIRSLKGSFYL